MRALLPECERSARLLDILYILSLTATALAAVPTTLALAFGGMLLALAIAALLLLVRAPKIPVVTQLVDLFLLIVRSVPLLVQLFVVFYGLPAIISSIQISRGLPANGGRWPAIVLVIIAFGLSTSANVYHNLQAALLSVPGEQTEAALAVGMTRARAFFRIVLPQAFSALIRPLGNTFITVVKATSIAYFVSVKDVMGAARIAGAPSFRFIEVYIGAALIYWAMSLMLGRAVEWAEKRARAHLAPMPD
jgi:L-cystine transport system permease protein